MSADALVPRPGENFPAYIRRVAPELAVLLYDAATNARDHEMYRAGHEEHELRVIFDGYAEKQAVRVARALAHRQTLDFGDYLLDTKPSPGAAASADEGFRSPKLTCRRCGEIIRDGIVTLRKGRFDRTSALCEGCIHDLDDDHNPSDENAA